MSVANEELRAVLDASAMVSYARPHMHVGELICEITDEGAFVAVPTVALLDAYAQVRGDEVARALLGVLVTLEGVRVIPLDETAVAKVSTAVPLAGGDLSRAHTLQVALANRAYYVTTDPQTAPSILDKEQVHAVPTYDAPN